MLKKTSFMPTIATPRQLSTPGIESVSRVCPIRHGLILNNSIYSPPSANEPEQEFPGGPIIRKIHREEMAPMTVRAKLNTISSHADPLSESQTLTSVMVAAGYRLLAEFCQAPEVGSPPGEKACCKGFIFEQVADD